MSVHTLDHMFIEIAHAATEAAAHEAESGLLGTFGLDWKLFLAQLVNFAVVIFALTTWVYKPLIKTMDERKKKIEEGVKNAASAEAKLGKAKETESKILKEARAQAQQIVVESKEKGDAEKQRRVDASKGIVEAQLAESKERLLREAEDARSKVTKDISALVLAAAEKVTNANLDDKEHRRLIDESIKELERSHG
jgi:F-type H+-transporting ATPase subunit b